MWQCGDYWMEGIRSSEQKREKGLIFHYVYRKVSIT